MLSRLAGKRRDWTYHVELGVGRLCAGDLDSQTWSWCEYIDRMAIARHGLQP
jgi:hypothetical protein